MDVVTYRQKLARQDFAETQCKRMNEAFARHDAIYRMPYCDTDIARKENDNAQWIKAQLLEAGWRLSYDGRKFQVVENIGAMVAPPEAPNATP